MRMKFSVLAVISILLAFPVPSVGQENFYTPDKLKPWIKWVSERHPELECATAKAGPTCEWPGILRIDVSPRGGRFEYSIALDKRGEVALPREREALPVNVRVLSQGRMLPAKVLSRDDGSPFVQTDKGVQTITGEFKWSTLPQSLYVPPASAILELYVNGTRVNFPRLKADRLWLAEESAPQNDEPDKARVEVFRKLSDGVPFKIETLLRLRVSGRVRSYSPGAILPAGSIPVEVSSSLPYQLGPDFSLSLQLRPGTHNVVVTSLFEAPPREISVATSSAEGWPDKEVVLWNGDSAFRDVELTGAIATDPDRVNVPPQYMGLPAYILQPGKILALTEKRRGETEPAPNILSLNREYWLHMDGQSFTVRDQISGTMNQGWRLDAAGDSELVRVDVNGSPQLITLGQANARGVEIRSQSVAVTAESEVEQTRSMNVVGWDFDPQQLSASLHLPPGWKLLEMTGVDSVSGSWLGSWNLLDIFIILLIAVISSEIIGIPYGLAATVGLVLAHGESDVPRLLWFHLLAGLAILKLFTVERYGLLRRFVRFYFVVNLLLLLLILTAMTFNQINAALFPQIGTSFNNSWEIIRPFFSLAEDNLLGWFLLVYILWALITLFSSDRSWKIFLSGAGAVVVLFFVLAAAPLKTSIVQEYDNTGGMETLSEAPAKAPAPAARRERRSLMENDMIKVPGQMVGFAAEAAPEDLLQVDPKAVIQTGTGIPDWRWSVITASWNGAVRKDRRAGLYLLNPSQNLLFSLIRLACLLIFGLAFLKQFRAVKAASSLAAALLLLAVCPPQASAQDFPPPAILTELEQRLMKDSCQGSCSAINQLKLNIAGDAATADLTVSSRGASAITLPGPADQFAIDTIAVDGIETKTLRRNSSGNISVRIPDGVHTIRALGRLNPKNPVTLNFEDSPQFIEVTANEWSADGLSNNVLINKSLQLSRIKQKEVETAGAAQAEGVLPSWLMVHRKLVLGLPWKTLNIIERIGDVSGPVTVRVPLLQDEAVLTDNIRVVDGNAVLSFPHGTSRLSWEGSLREKPSLHLVAPAASAGNGALVNITETWSLQCSPIWRCSASGLRPRASIGDNQWKEQWEPFPGESVDISVTKPLGADGTTMTIESVNYSVTPGESIMTGDVNIAIKSSEKTLLPVTLPEGAVVQSVYINSGLQRISLDHGKMDIPVAPGDTNIALQFRTESNPMKVLWHVPVVNIGRNSANVRTNLNVPAGRWLLFAGGAPWGPVVLVWSKVVFLLLFSVIAARAGLSVPGIGGLVLLGLGLVTLPVAYLAVPVAWFAAMEWRSRNSLTSSRLFNLFQIGLALLTVMMLTVLYLSVQNGLVMSPEMAVIGNGSTASSLNWYSDFSSGGLPSPWILSLPVWCWRAVMLLWSVWLVWALISWLKWAFACFTKDGVWK